MLGTEAVATRLATKTELFPLRQQISATGRTNPIRFLATAETADRHNQRYYISP